MFFVNFHTFLSIEERSVDIYAVILVKRHNLLFCHARLLFSAKPVKLALFLQPDKISISVVIADAELFPVLVAVLFLLQRLIVGVVKIQAANLIFARMERVGPRRGAQALNDCRAIGGRNQVLPFMAKLRSSDRFRWASRSFPVRMQPSILRLFGPTVNEL